MGISVAIHHLLEELLDLIQHRLGIAKARAVGAVEFDVGGVTDVFGEVTAVFNARECVASMQDERRHPDRRQQRTYVSLV